MLDKQREMLNKLWGFVLSHIIAPERIYCTSHQKKKKPTGKEINLLIHVTEILGQGEAGEWGCEVRS